MGIASRFLVHVVAASTKRVTTHRRKHGVVSRGRVAPYHSAAGQGDNVDLEARRGIPLALALSLARLRAPALHAPPLVVDEAALWSPDPRLGRTGASG